jgi:ParB family chromosome partitioning protein
MESAMTLKSVPLSMLCPPKDNPRRTLDKAAIASLAESIKTDGVLQNLVVEPDDDGKFRVVSGKRRFLALKLLKRQGKIDDDFKVPVEVRKNLQNGDALRIATVENVQRAALDPVDEAEAFAGMLQNGATIEDLTAKTGLSPQTIRRRLAVSDLCDEVKVAIRKGELPLGTAEAMTLGTAEQQRSILNDIKEGSDLDGDGIREMLLAEKPSAAIAIFSMENYTGTFTRDLFGDEESTYFDDIEQFMALQKEAADTLAEKHGKNAAWVDVYNVYGVPWWQYREAKKREAAGVVINLKPTGLVEIKKGLARHEVKEQVVEATKETPEAAKERPVVSAGLVRYVALQKSMVVQAALLGNPRKAKEAAAVYLLLAFGPGHPVRIAMHQCITSCGASEKKSKAFTTVRAEASELLGRVMRLVDDFGSPAWAGSSEDTPLELYKAVQALSNEDLDRLTALLIVLSFGQCGVEELDTEESLFNTVAADLGVALRDWWTPDAEFFNLMRKDQLEALAIESGASMRMSKLKDYSKKDLVNALAKYFERTADPAAELDEHDQKGRTWLPGTMSFPARAIATMADPR